jgi:hypothetical protein
MIHVGIKDVAFKGIFCHNMVHMIIKFVGRDNCQYLYLNCDIIVCKYILQL